MKSPTTARRSAAMVAGSLALAIATPAVCMAKPLCVSNDNNASVLVVPKPKLKTGSNAVVGYFGGGSSISSATGAAVVNAASDSIGFTIEKGAVNVGTVPFPIAFASTTVVILLFPSDGKLDVGDTGPGWFGGVPASFTVVDCTTVPAIP